MKCWIIIGFVGQAAFFMRFLIQWLASEKRGESYFPIYFWYLSLVGGVILLGIDFQQLEPGDAHSKTDLGTGVISRGLIIFKGPVTRGHVLHLGVLRGLAQVALAGQMSTSRRQQERQRHGKTQLTHTVHTIPPSCGRFGRFSGRFMRARIACMATVLC